MSPSSTFSGVDESSTTLIEGQQLLESRVPIARLAVSYDLVELIEVGVPSGAVSGGLIRRQQAVVQGESGSAILGRQVEAHYGRALAWELPLELD